MSAPLCSLFLLHFVHNCASSQDNLKECDDHHLFNGLYFDSYVRALIYYGLRKGLGTNLAKTLPPYNCEAEEEAILAMEQRDKFNRQKGYNTLLKEYYERQRWKYYDELAKDAGTAWARERQPFNYYTGYGCTYNKESYGYPVYRLKMMGILCVFIRNEAHLPVTVTRPPLLPITRIIYVDK
ncbi:hypothetical protein OESDEN_17066 [Oesophagostomum dentatum]|uniref:Uncharacterized protein n=1 Tax=Oesophagostomum dentatum TaxID=61180 RepID=A0A0B1SI94_OESDE|nr:hypothetical protein OESDEN_17066 [Oesophagostomum dentatum]